MGINIYIKRGAKNYKEKKYIEALEKALASKSEDAAFQQNFVSATNIEELKELHDHYCIESVDYVDVNKKGEEKAVSAEGETTEEPQAEKSAPGYDNDAKPDDFIDPFNKENPVVRDYVLNDDMANNRDKQDNQAAQQQSFNEPVTFGEAFEFPADIEEQKNEQQKGQQQTKEEKKQQKEPINPSFNDMSGSKKKKSTHRFAKYIVETICMLSEKGIIWYATSEINESKLAEYELTGEVDLTLLVTLENGQEATVKQFFQQQCKQADQLSKISKEEKEDLIDALAEVMLEKGIAPTPTQELIMMSLKILGERVIIAFTMKAQTNSLLEQLRAMKGEHVPYQDVPPQPQQETKQEEPIAEEIVHEQQQTQQQNSALQIQEYSDDETIIDKTITTKE